MYQLDLFAETTKTTKNTKAARIRIKPLHNETAAEAAEAAKALQEIEKLKRKLHVAKRRLKNEKLYGSRMNVRNTQFMIQSLESTIRAYSRYYSIH